MIETTVKRIDPLVEPDNFIAAYVSRRIFDSARHLTPEVSAKFVTQAIMTRLYQGDQNLCVIAIVDKDGKPVGHAVAVVGLDDQGAFVSISQLRADGNVGSALKQAVDEIEKWARQRGAMSMILTTGGSDKDWEKEMGFKIIRKDKLRSLEGEYAPLVL